MAKKHKKNKDKIDIESIMQLLMDEPSPKQRTQNKVPRSKGDDESIDNLVEAYLKECAGSLPFTWRYYADEKVEMKLLGGSRLPNIRICLDMIIW